MVVLPAQAGTQGALDSGLRRNDVEIFPLSSLVLSLRLCGYELRFLGQLPLVVQAAAAGII